MLGFIPVIIWSLSFVLLVSVVSYNALIKARNTVQALSAIQGEATAAEVMEHKRAYRDAKRQYNHLVTHLPSAYIAKVFGFKEIA